MSYLCKSKTERTIENERVFVIKFLWSFCGQVLVVNHSHIFVRYLVVCGCYGHLSLVHEILYKDGMSDPLRNSARGLKSQKNWLQDLPWPYHTSAVNQLKWPLLSTLAPPT